MNDNPVLSELGRMLVKVLDCKPVLGYGYLLEEDSKDVAQPQGKKAAEQTALPVAHGQQGDSEDVPDRDEEVDGPDDLEMPQFPFYEPAVPVKENHPRRQG